MTCEGAAEGGCKLPAAAGDLPLGVTEFFHRDPGDTGLEADEVGPLCKKGAIWVVVEEAIAKGDRVFYRHTTAGSEQAGAFRNDADGVAQLMTLTPTAANDTVYALEITVRDRSDRELNGSPKVKTFRFSITSDGTATATEICDAFRTAMQANAAFDALITSAGTATLTLTAADKGNDFDVYAEEAGAWASITETAAAAPDCDELPSNMARWLGASITVGSDRYAPP